MAKHGFNHDLLREPGEKRLLRRTSWAIIIACLLCCTLTLSLFFFWVLLALLTLRILRLRYLAEAVEIGPDQFPRAHEVLRRCARRMGLEAPKLYISTEPGRWPVFSVPIPKPAIMMHANWLYMLDDEELEFFVYHELAHGILGHRPYLTPVNVLENMGPVSWILTTPLEIVRYALRPWLRLADFSADRVALLYLDGKLDTVSRALAKTIVGEELAPQVSGEAFLQQCRVLRFGWFLTLYEVFSGRIGAGRRLSRLAAYHEAGYCLRDMRLLAAHETGQIPEDLQEVSATTPLAAAA